MNTQNNTFKAVGIDTSKATLDVAYSGADVYFSVDNNESSSSLPITRV